jgi:hypothetical protein
MSSLHPARRSAERFDSLLHSEHGASTHARDAELLALVNALQALPQPEPRPAFSLDLRERLMLAAETELVGADATDAKFRDLTDRLTVRTTRTPRERRMAIALGGFAMVGATTSMAVAAQSALPGDTLYPLKRAIENVETGFNVSDSAKGNAILANATGRLDEVRSLSQSGDADVDAVVATLDTFADQATEASELLLDNFQATGSQASINQLRDFTAASLETLAVLEPLIPAEAKGALLDAAQAILAIDGQAAFLCPECDSLGIISIPTQLVAEQVEAAPTSNVASNPNEGSIPKQPTEGRSSQSGQAASEPSGDAVTIPTQPQPNQGGQGGNDSKGDQGGLPGVGVSTLPSLPVPDPGEVISDTTSTVGEVVNGVVGGLTGGSGNKK